MTRSTSTPSPHASATKARAGSKAEATTTVPKMPTLDLRGLLDKLKLPGVDVAALIDSRRKDVEALLAANEQAYRGFEAVTRRQGEMLVAAMQGLDSAAKDALARQGTTERAARIADHAQQAFSHALADMKEIAELSARSQQQVVQTLGSRLREGIAELGTPRQAKP